MLNRKLGSLLLVCALGLGVQEAGSTRLGGGVFFDQQSASVVQRATAVPGTFARQASAAVQRSAPVVAAAASQRGALWGAVAAGLGLVWLASALGLGDAFAQFLLLALLAVVILALVGLFRWRRSAAPSALAYPAGSAVAGSSQFDPAIPRGYNAKNVGNDASARPWEQLAGEVEAAGGFDSTARTEAGWGVPDGFDTAGFLKASKSNFVSLQEAWDRSDIPALRAMMTDGMIEQIKVQLVEREQALGGSVNRTEVVMLEARLLGIEDFPEGQMASVEFSGLIREDVSSGPNPFREVWNITRSRSGPGGWLVAGVQALQ